MKKNIKISIWIVFALSLFGCGQKGPLKPANSVVQVETQKKALD
ncbi:LPS translocon maturation chaperone LptM [Pleionea sediminis]